MLNYLKDFFGFSKSSSQASIKKPHFSVFALTLFVLSFWSNHAYALGFSFGFGSALQSFDLNGIIFSLLFEIGNIPDLISIFSYIAGVFLAAMGILSLRKHTEDPQEPLNKGLMRLAIGAGFLALPQLTEVVVNTFGLKSILFRAAILGNFDLGQSLTLGVSSFDFASLIQNIGSQTADIPLLISAFSYISGVAFLAIGLGHLKRNADQPNPDQFRQGIGKIAVSAGLLALPQITDVVVNTLGLGPEFFSQIWVQADSLDAGRASEDLKTLSLRSIGQLVTLPEVVSIISYVIGVAFVFYGLLTLKGYADSPNQGGTIKDAIGRFVIGGSLLSLPAIGGILASSLGLDGLEGSAFGEEFRILNESINATPTPGGGATDYGAIELFAQLRDQSSALPLVIIVASFVGGSLMAAAGLLALKKHIDSPNESLKNALGKLGIAGALFGLPVLIDVVLNTLGFQQTLTADVLTDLTAARGGASSTTAAAAPASVNNFISILNNSDKALIAGSTLVSAFTFIAGVFFIALGVVSLKGYLTNDNQEDNLKGAFARFAAGGFFLVLPFFIQLLTTTLFATDISATAYAQDVSVDGQEGFQRVLTLLLTSSLSFTDSLIAIAVFTGIVLVVYGIVLLKKHVDNPSQEHIGKALGRMVVGTFLISLDFFGDTIATTFGFDRQDEIKAGAIAETFGDNSASSTTGGLAATSDTFFDQIGSLPEIILFLGVIAGLFLIFTGLMNFRKHIDSPSQEPISKGIVRLVVGGALISLYFLGDTIAKTLGFDIEQGRERGGLAGDFEPENPTGSTDGFAGLVDTLFAQTATLPEIILFVAIIVGLILIFSGLLNFKNHADNPSQEHVGKSLGRLTMGAALLSLYFVTEVISKTFGFDGDGPEYRGDNINTETGSDGIWALIDTFLEQTGGISGIVYFFAFIAGFVLIFAGLYQFKSHAEDPSQNPIGRSIGRLFAGSALISLQFFGSLITETFGLDPTAQHVGVDGFAQGDLLSNSSGSTRADVDGELGGLINNVIGQIGGIRGEGSDGVLDSIPGLIVFLAFLAGLSMIVMGVLSFKKHLEDQSQNPIGKALTEMAVGGGLLSLGALVPIIISLFGLETMDTFGLTNVTLADNIAGTELGDTGGQASKISGAINSLTENMTFYGGLLEILAYVFGLGFLAVTLWKFKQHVESPRDVNIWEPVKHMAAATAFLGLPAFVSVISETLGLGGAPDLNISAGNSGDFDFSVGEGDPNGVDTLFLRLVGDLYPSLMNMIEIFAILAGITLIMVGIHNLTKSGQQGPGALSMGTAFTFIAGAALIATPEMMSIFTNTLFGTTDVKVNAALSFLDGGGEALVDRSEQVLEGVLAFMVIIGFISFIRGWFILKAFAEGNQQATFLAASSHIIAGVLAVNLGGLINIVQNTLKVTGVEFN